MPIDQGPQTFPRSEYLRRLDVIKAKMAEQGVAALVVSQPSNITYLSGYTALSAYVPQALIVFLSAEEPTFVVRRMDAPAAIHQCFFGRSQVIGYPEALIGTPDRDGYDFIIDLLRDNGVDGVGIEVSHLSAQAAEKFRAGFPKARVVDCSAVVTWTRLIKSDAEIELMREAAAIADAGIARAVEVIRPGVREADAIAEIMATLARGANGKAGTSVASINMCTSPRTGTSHIQWSEGAFRQGSQINLELGGVRHGYTSAIMRTLIIGQPPERLRLIHEAEVAGLEAALATVKPGRTCHDVAEAFYQTLGKHGFQKESRCGYAIGIDWLEPSASLKTGDRTELKPNMTFHLMLGNWIDEDFGYVISETFRVTESGVEVLTKAPRSLFVI